MARAGWEIFAYKLSLFINKWYTIILEMYHFMVCSVDQ